jgi:tetratricopeptide (TPR) repeat protein
VRRRRIAAGVLLLLAGCNTTPVDAFAAAQAAMRREDLLAALLAYDAVPVRHPRYPEARAGAAAVELRMRRGHELMLEGMIRRGEWRDAEALRSLQQAREVWPDLPGVDALIAATRQRLETLGTRPNQSPAAATTVAMPDAPLLPTAAAGEVTPPPAGGTKLADESVVLGLVAVETRLGRGELELAVVDLLELARRFPDDVRVQRRLVRVLQQRALLRYGQGALTAALQDLERVLAIEPANAEVTALWRAVCAEAAPAATPAGR